MASRCKACGMEMIWARTEAGKTMPLDGRRLHAVERGEEPVARGVFRVNQRRDPYGLLTCRPAVADDVGDPDAMLYLTHFGNCVASATFSGQGRRRETP